MADSAKSDDDGAVNLPSVPTICRKETLVPLLVFVNLLIIFTLAFSIFVITRDYPCTDDQVIGSMDYTCGFACGKACVGKGETCFNKCFKSCAFNDPLRVATGHFNSKLSLDAIHHVGITVDDLANSVKFYTEVLGGIEVGSAVS